MSIFLYVCFYLSPSVYLFLSLCFCIFIFISLLLLNPCFYVSPLSLLLCLSFFMFVFISPSLSLILRLSFFIFIIMSLILSLTVFLSLSYFIFVSSLYFITFVITSVLHYLCFISLFLYLYFYVSFLHLSHFLFLYIYFLSRSSFSRYLDKFPSASHLYFLIIWTICLSFNVQLLLYQFFSLSLGHNSKTFSISRILFFVINFSWFDFSGLIWTLKKGNQREEEEAIEEKERTQNFLIQILSTLYGRQREPNPWHWPLNFFPICTKLNRFFLFSVRNQTIYLLGINSV